ncbi:hypothetical protein [Planctobacterium marinum]|uniref:Uncharacterized protein n=1 Tax=Planctobacterium marinum TaxID=1631968 RepID=A0AA48HKI2_9ALTE|nr:hypothetical protein MACH26_40340 [Planctobacterium marinum]
MQGSESPGQHALLERCIAHCQSLLANWQLTPRVHFELEGMCIMPRAQILDLRRLNQQLAQQCIPGEVKPEYWPGQWEYVSLLAGQTPLQEARYIARLKQLLPNLMLQQGAQEVLLKPVVWHGSDIRYVAGSSTLFARHSGSVHIPNAIQVNVSVADVNGNNKLPDSGLGEWIQYHLLQNSYACSVLYLPEEEAFQRLKLRTEFGLDAELSSPWELSGGYQGSIALYKEKGKHDQPLNPKPLILGAQKQPLCWNNDWQKACRIEHRLGATSKNYDPFVNVLFILLNILDAVVSWQSGECAPTTKHRSLPASLADSPDGIGALRLFQEDSWFASSIDNYCQNLTIPEISSLGQHVKQNYLKGFHPKILS